MLLRHSFFNLAGTAGPLMLALVSVPLLIRLAGAERFGCLALIWAIAGYAGVLDLGLSRTIARRIASGSTDHPAVSPRIVWRLAGRIWLGAAVVSSGAWLIWQSSGADLVASMSVPREEWGAAAALVVMIPAITTSSVLRGVLEGAMRFGSVGLLRGGFAVLGYVLLIGTAFVAPRLDMLVGAMALVRVLELGAHVLVVQAVMRTWSRQKVEPAVGVWRESGWFLASQLISPFTMYMDRFLIGSLLGLAAVTHYTVPYELATKLLLVPIALSAALFPRFARIEDGTAQSQGYETLCVAVGAVMLPLVVALILFGGDVLQVWVQFSRSGESNWALIALAAGIWFNAVAQIPYAWLQARGAVPATVALHIIELPLYFLVLLWGLSTWGIVAAAVAWAGRAAVDCAALLVLAAMRGASPVRALLSPLLLQSGLLSASILIVPLLIGLDVPARLGLIVGSCVAVTVVSWRYLLPAIVQSEIRARVLDRFGWRA